MTAMSPSSLRQPALFLAFLALLSCPSPTLASEAAFSPDGSAVFAVCDTENTLEKISEGEGTLRKVEIDLGGRRGCFRGITGSDQGGFYLVTEHRLWHWKPGDKAAELVKEAPKDTILTDLACNRKNGQLMLFAWRTTATDRYGNPVLLAMNDRKGSLQTVWLRHLTAPVVCAEFLPDGTLLFSTEGDLWHGILTVGGSGPGELAAYRYAPLAQRYNYNGTSMEEGVESIAVSARKAYVYIKRMGGSGDGHVSRLDLPPPMKDGMFKARNSLKEMLAAMKSVEELDGTESWPSLCGSPDGKRVYFADGSGPGRRHFLIKDDGEGAPFKTKAADE